MAPLAPTCNAVKLYIVIASASQLAVAYTWRVAAIIHFVFKEIGYADARNFALSNKQKHNMNTEVIVQDEHILHIVICKSDNSKYILRRFLYFTHFMRVNYRHFQMLCYTTVALSLKALPFAEQ